MLGLGLQLHQYASSGGGGASGARKAAAPSNASSIFLDGVDQYLTQPDGGANSNIFSNLNGSSSWTIAFWIKLTENPTFIIWKGNYFTSNYLNISTDSTGDLTIFGANAGATTINTKWPTDLSLNTWYHVAITSDGTGTNRVNECYVDGVSAGVASSNTTVASATDLESPSGSELLKIGALHTLIYYSFYMDDLACWNRVLPANQVQTLTTHRNWLGDFGDYNLSSNLQLFYRFDDGANSIVNPTTTVNSTAQNRPITLVNTEINSWVSGGQNVPYA